MKKLFVLFGCVTAVALYALDSDPAVANAPDKKIAAMKVYGLRRVEALAPDKLQLVVGASSTGVVNHFNSYRIVSPDDPNYAYEKFVRPREVKILNPKDRVELTVPEGFEPVHPKAADVRSFTRTFAELTLPHPMVNGKTYSVVALGVDGTMVTAARTGATFKYDGSHVEPARAVEEPEALTVMGLRGASSIGNGIIMLEFGAAYSFPGGNKMKNYKITVNGKPAGIRNMGRRSRIDVYLPVGWPFAGIMQHDVFLELDRPLADGDKVRVELAPAVTSGAGATEFVFDAKKSLSDSIKVNQVGYLPDAPKRAHLGRWLGSFPDKSAELVAGTEPSSSGTISTDDFFANALNPAKADSKKEEKAGAASALAPFALRFDAPPAFEIVETSSGKTVYKGQSKLGHNGVNNDGRNNHSGENVYYLDFDGFKTPGKYFISVPGVGRSFDFEIAADVYKKAFEKQAYGVFAQRCGIELAPPYSDWRRVACHNKGVVVTEEQRCEAHEFPKGIAVMVPNTKGHSDAYRKLIGDPTLIAYFPFEGNYENKVSGGMKLVPREAVNFAKDGGVTGNKDHQAYTTVSGKKNGFDGTLKYDESKGLSISFWYKKDDSPRGSKYGGILTELVPGRHVGLTLSAGWGVIQLRQNRGEGDAAGWKRVGDNKWRHFLITEEAGEPTGKSDNSRAWRTRMYVDGELQKDFANTGRLGELFTFASLDDEGAAGGSFDELRIYNRTFTPEEAAVLCERTSAEIPLRIETSGGHHDAGDYNPRSHIDVAMVLLSAYDAAPQKFYDGQLNIPEKNNGIPDIVDEALWALKLWIGLQDPVDGGVRNGTESDGDPNFIQTVEMDTKGDFAWAKDSKGSLLFAATMAQASRILKSVGKDEMAADYLKRAERAYKWGSENKPRINDGKKFGDFYIAPRAYAAVQLYRATGDRKYHDDFLNHSPWKANKNAKMITDDHSYNMSWAAYSYALLPDEMADKELKQAVVKALCQEADMYISGSEKMAYKFIRHPYAPISWGTGAYENFLVPVWHAWAATGNPKYFDWMVRTCDNTLGNNPMNQSWIVGLGEKSVRAPLHNSRYNPTGMVVDGMQTQGPFGQGKTYNYAETAYPKHDAGFATLHAFIDSHFAIAMDEGTIPNQANTMAAFGLLLPDQK